MKNYSSTYLSSVIAILAIILPKLGLEIGTDALTTTVSTLVAIGGMLWGLYQRYLRGDVTPLGFKK